MSDQPNPLAQPAGIVRSVSDHAFRRWMERTRTRSEIRALAMLQKHLARAEEVQLAPHFQAIALLEHDLTPARYLRFDTWIFVVSMDGVLLTVHAGEAKRWLPLGTKPSRKKRRLRRSG